MYVIAEPCIGVKEGECKIICPVDCIEEGDKQYFIDPDRCIDCGSCASVCPVEAIYRDDELPEEWIHFQGLNADFFKI